MSRDYRLKYDLIAMITLRKGVQTALEAEDPSGPEIVLDGDQAPTSDLPSESPRALARQEPRPAVMAHVQLREGELPSWPRRPPGAWWLGRDHSPGSTSEGNPAPGSI